MKIKLFENFEELNEASSENLMDIKQKIFLKAKKQYMDSVEKLLEQNGITVYGKKVTDNIENFSSDAFDCDYKKTKFQIQLSNRGISLTVVGLKNFPAEYSTKIESLVKKLNDSLK